MTDSINPAAEETQAAPEVGALFNANAETTLGGHSNLGTTGLKHSSYDAAYTAVINQTTKQQLEPFDLQMTVYTVKPITP